MVPLPRFRGIEPPLPRSRIGIRSPPQLLREPEEGLLYEVGMLIRQPRQTSANVAEKILADIRNLPLPPRGALRLESRHPRCRLLALSSDPSIAYLGANPADLSVEHFSAAAARGLRQLGRLDDGFSVDLRDELSSVAGRKAVRLGARSAAAVAPPPAAIPATFVASPATAPIVSGILVSAFRITLVTELRSQSPVRTIRSTS